MSKVSLKTKLINTVLYQKGAKSLKELEKLSNNAKKINNDLLIKIIKENENTVYGQAHNFKDVHSYEDYKKIVSLSQYEDYLTYINRIAKNNEQNVLTNKKIVAFAHTSGSVGVPKLIPVTQDALDLYSKFSSIRTIGSANEKYKFDHNGHSIPKGKGFIACELGFSNTLSGIREGGISSFLLDNQKKHLEDISTSPLPILYPTETMDMKYMKARFALEEENVSYMASGFMTTLVDILNYIKENHEMLCNDIEKGEINESINASNKIRNDLKKYLKPNPNRANELRNEFAKGFDTPIIPRIWKNMAFIGAIGTAGFQAYTNKMRLYAGKDIYIDNNTFAASEALIGTCKDVEEFTYVLIPGSAFYEFIPVGGDEKDIVTIDQLVVGKNYELVITNLSGLYRYKIEDVITITDFYNEAPMFKFSHRKSQIISIAGEKLNESNFAWVLEEFRKETGIEILDYAVYPDRENITPRIVMFIEPSQLLDNSKLSEYRDVMEDKLRKVNVYYDQLIKTNGIGKLDLHILQAETFALYRDIMVNRGASINQIKSPRIIDNPFKEKFFFKLIEK